MTTSEEYLEQLAAEWKQTAVEYRADLQVERGRARAQAALLAAANVRVAELEEERDGHYEAGLRLANELNTVRRNLAAANARVAELEAECGALEHKLKAEIDSDWKGKALAERLEKNAANARMAELERALEHQQALVEREEIALLERDVARGELKQEKERFAAMILEYGNLADAANARADAAEQQVRNLQGVTEVLSGAESEAVALRAEQSEFRAALQLAQKEADDLRTELGTANALLAALKSDTSLVKSTQWWNRAHAHLSGQGTARPEAKK